MTQSHHECCSHSAQSSGSTLQALDEVEFERGIWAAARDGEGARVIELLGRGTHPSAQDTSGYTALHYAARAGHGDIVQVRCRIFEKKEGVNRSFHFAFSVPSTQYTEKLKF